mmetsp:Transcript_6690/g.22851  ORF Transcript_6690/g.22851 Transcript_6690/m.22851 type:complete len:224 (+) Transcript_6690:1961-2632(+)
MDEVGVARARTPGRERLCVRDAALGRGARLGEVHHEVQGQRVARVPREHALHALQGLRALRPEGRQRRPEGICRALVEVIPGVERHQRLGAEGLQVQEVRLGVRGGAESLGEGPVPRVLPLPAAGLEGGGVAREAEVHRSHERHLPRRQVAPLAREEFQGLVDSLPRREALLERHGHVHVRPQGVREPPEAHDARRVRAEGCAEVAARLSVIEPKREQEALVE